MAQDEDYVGREQSQVKHYILEKYLPSFKQLAIPFVITTNTDHLENVLPGLSVQKQSRDAVQRLIATADHTLVF